MQTIFQGNAFIFGNNIDTDLIIAARYLNTSNPVELAKHAMEDADPEFVNKISLGDIIVAGENFGCGSSREHAPIAIKYAGISCVIAKSFARIFYRNAFNTGLAILEVQESDKIAANDRLEIDIASGTVKNLTKNESYEFTAIPPFMMELVNAGGLMNYASTKIKAQG
jgi:3-isopropylmalate/(R)-2-methylmalate dehydratase small subunit